MSKSKIEWTDAVWNPVTGCTKVSDGCKHCYAEVVAKRFWGERKFTDIICHDDRLEQPLHWKKARMIFVNSMSDLFHENVPFEFIESVYLNIIQSKQHIFQILTKRPETALEFYQHLRDKKMFFDNPFRNIWLGVSVENQEQADKRIPILLQIPAAVRWISAEPLLGPIELSKEAMLGWNNIGHDRLDVAYAVYEKGLSWIVAGGESGPGARPMHPDWVRSLRDQCNAAGLPFFFKQWGEYLPTDQAESFVQGNIGNEQFKMIDSDRQTYWKTGKSKSGHLLDGREYKEFPQT